MTVLVTIVLVTIVVSAMCSLFEATLYSTRVATLESSRQKRRQRLLAEQMLHMKKNIVAPVSAILILNTIANTAGATLAGMFAARILGTDWVPAFSISLTAAILIFSEILPKTFGALYWKQIWPLIVLPLSLMRVVLYPLVWLTQQISRPLTRRATSPLVTEDEIVGMIRLGAQAGQLTASEMGLLYAALRFDDVVCRQVMVPRDRVVTLDIHDSLATWLEVARTTQYTRYPLCRGSIDRILGLVHIKDLIGLPHDEPLNLGEIVRPMRRVSESAPIGRLLREMQGRHPHMAVVVNAQGEMTGIVTLEDVLEQIVGPVSDEFDADGAETEIRPEGHDAYLVDGTALLGQLNRALNLQLMQPGAVTVSEVLVARVGRPLQAGEVVDLPGAQAEVLAAVDGRPTRLRFHLGQHDEG